MIPRMLNKCFIKQLLASLKKLFVSGPQIGKVLLTGRPKFFFTEIGQFLELSLFVNVNRKYHNIVIVNMLRCINYLPKLSIHCFEGGNHQELVLKISALKI